MPTDMHSKAHHLIDQSLIGEISQTDDRWLRNHLAECAECETFQNFSHSVLRSLGDLSFGVSAGATDRIQRVIAERVTELRNDHSLRLRALAGGVAALILTGLGSSAAWRAASLVSRSANVAGSSLHLGVLIFWLLPSLGASLILFVMPILRENVKEGQV
ncbi:MAG: hypothetical protein WA708_10570 [Acidobacteriaceae bacterium]